jgi:thioredoxin-like negative regulator of GroEL
MIHTIEIAPTWTPLVTPLADLLASPNLETRDSAAVELRRLLAAAGSTEPESERLIAALAADPSDRDLRARLLAAARTVDARAGEEAK